jgi:YD repeat-containing protein
VEVGPSDAGGDKSDSGAYDVGYGYDALNRLATVTDHVGGGGTTTYRYDDGGRLGSYDYPNGVSSGFTYDALDRVQSIKIGTGLGTANEQLVASFGYTFYATGNRHTLTELNGRGVTWGYDSLWRLTNETIAGSTVAGAISYGYDNVGNRLSRTSSVSVTGRQQPRESGPADLA